MSSAIRLIISLVVAVSWIQVTSFHVFPTTSLVRGSGTTPAAKKMTLLLVNPMEENASMDTYSTSDKIGGSLVPVTIAQSPEVQHGPSKQRKIIARYTDIFPEALFRICGKSKKFVLREHAIQVAKGSPSYDLTLAEDGLVHPAPLDDVFIGPNGASLRPLGVNMWDLLTTKRGITNVLEIPAGTKIPESLVLLHEHADNFSLQCTQPMQRKALEALMNEFSKELPFYPKNEYFTRHPISEL